MVQASVVAGSMLGPYLLGDKFTAADVLWGTALAWTTSFQLVPLRPEFEALFGPTISASAGP